MFILVERYFELLLLLFLNLRIKIKKKKRALDLTQLK